MSNTEVIPSILIIGRRTFYVSSNMETFGNKAERVYTLVGVRGAKYRTVRNVSNQEKMFLISERRFGLAAGFEGIWLTDRNGKLEVC